MLESQTENSDPYIDRMRSARKGSSVLKLNLVTLRSSVPSAPIFAFEGKDDKTAYYHWAKRARNDLEYHPFPCDGKEQVLQLRDVVQRDMSGLSKGVYFFVDRDFDDLRGREASNDIFVTDKYSIENYLVDDVVLNELLKNEFNCHLALAHAKYIREEFGRMWDLFCQYTREINFRLFVMRRLGIKLLSPLPEKIGKIANVQLDGVFPVEHDVKVLVHAQREPSEDELAGLRDEFDGLDKYARYRGKFALMFFMKWLEQLALDYNSEKPRLFPKIPNSKVHYQKVGIDSLASKSNLPAGLAEFLAQVNHVIH